MNIYQPTHKHCNKCNQTLSIDNFYRDNSKKDGHRTICKLCDLSSKSHNHNSATKLKPVIINNEKLCSSCGISKSLTGFFKDKKSIGGVSSHCKQCRKSYNQAYRKKHSEKLSAQKKIYRQENKEYFQNYMKNYNAEYKKIINEKIKLKRKDPLFRLTDNIRALIRCSITGRGYTKKSKTYEILGCSFTDFKLHIEQQFVNGMSWNNRSEWHLDHIIPVSFAKTKNEIIMLNHYSNFRPLWASDNMAKHNTISEDAINHPIYQKIMDIRK